MLIDSFGLVLDAAEEHSIEIAANREVVYQALWTTDLGASWIVKGLLLLRSVPQILLRPARRSQANRPITLQTIIDAGFGVLAEEPNREIVLGVMGPFWRPVGNVLPFNEENFRGPVPSGVAHAVWNFAVQDRGEGRTLLSTETRVICGGSFEQAEVSRLLALRKAVQRTHSPPHASIC